MRSWRLIFGFVALWWVVGVGAQQNRIDTVTPMAPELAAYGKYAVGVRTLRVIDRDQPDIPNTKQGAPTVRADRPLTLEVWYPASLGADQHPGVEYRVVTRDPSATATLRGRAVRDAQPALGGDRFPLVIISHGYPGNRYLLSHLGENLASKGFVVASIDHKDSTYDDLKVFASTLYHRPFDQLFVLNEMDRLGRNGSGSFLSGLVDADRTGLVGYSMGGYGVLNVVGAGFSAASETFPNAPPNRLLADRAAENPEFRKTLDPRIKAAVPIAPWGMVTGLWDAQSLKGITTPLLLVAGSVDDVAGYEKGVKAIYQGATNADRYLLTFVNANHNAGAPIPAPLETYVYSETLHAFPFLHYADAVWDTTRMNNILVHFVTAYFDRYLKGDRDKVAYFEVVPEGKNAVYSLDKDGKPTPAHNYWKGFPRNTAVGLTLDHATPAR